MKTTLANAQTIIRHALNPSLRERRVIREKNNVKSEANWSIFQRDFVLGFQSILEFGKPRFV